MVLPTHSETMNKKSIKQDLDDEDKAFIVEIFFSDIVPKLSKLHARNGILNCEFADGKYKNWIVYFRSRGTGFEITEFEYDEDSYGMDLDL